MGIWDQLRSVATRVTSRSISSESKESRGLYGVDIGDAVRSNGAQKLEDYVPDPERREKIGRIVTNLGKFAVSSAVNEFLKGFTGGIRVYEIVKEGLKDQPSQSAHRNKKPDLPVMLEEMQAKMEKMQEETDNKKVMLEEMQAKMEKMQEEMDNKKATQLNAVSAHCVKTSEPLKEFLTEPSDELAPLKTDVRKVMIRSRL